MSRLRKIPATVMTGFLGAGKTTLIRHILSHAKGRRLALIVNEFGDVGVDGELLAACGGSACQEDDIIELANGCLCCTVSDEFLPTMEKLLVRPLPPEHILIETSGLALPKPLVKAFDWPEVRARVTVDGVIAVVDGPALQTGRFESTEEERARPDHDNPLEEVFTDQLACADLVVLNKIDLLDADALATLRHDLSAKLRPGVRLLATEQGQVDPAVLLGLDAAAEDDLAARPSLHDAETAHDHDDFTSFGVALPVLADPAVLVRRLPEILAQFDILRLKGFVAVEGKAMRHVVQAVGPRVQGYYDRFWKADEARASHVVVIGFQGLDRDAITTALQQAAA